MARTLDDIYDRLYDVLDAINNGTSRGGGHTSNSVIDDIDDIIDDFRIKLGDLSDNLDKYNTTFEKDIIANQEKNSKEINDIIKQQTDLFNQNIKYQKEQIKKQQEILNDVNATEQQKKDAQKKIHRYEKQIDDKRQRFNEKDETKEAIKQINKLRREIVEDQEDKRRFLNSKVGRNISRMEDIRGNTRMYGKVIQSFGNSIGGKFGGAISKAGTNITKLAGAAGKAVPVIGWVIAALQLLNDAIRALAVTSNDLQKIENEKSKIKTQRDIKLNTLAFQNGIDDLQTQSNIIQKKLALATNIGTQKAQIAIMKANAITGTGLNSITNGINEAAWEALNKRIDIEAAEGKLSNTERYDKQKTENEIKVLQADYSAKQAERYFQAQQAYLDATTQMTEAQVKEFNAVKEHYIASAFSKEQKTKTGNSGKDYGDVNGMYHTNHGNAMLSGMFGQAGVGDFFNTQLLQQADVERILTEQENNLNATTALSKSNNDLRLAYIKGSTDNTNAILDLKKTVSDMTVDAIKERRHMYTQFSQIIEKLSLELQKNLYDSGNGKGLTSSNQLHSYNIAMQNIISDITGLTGLTHNEIIALQNSYGNTTGRSLFGNATDLTKAAYVAKFTGDINLPSELANATEIFNMGMSDTLENINRIALQVNKMGLDGRKYMKDMAQNLKLAQKYTFKNGVNGLMNMAKWAQNVRFDMSQLPTILDKLLDGGLEGAITQGAQLQVLGGNFAMGADPLAMMYEAIDDPEALAKRYAGMLKGMGTWNNETGQVDFRGVPGLMLRQMSKITGLSIDNLRNMASQDIKREKITASTSLNSDLDEDQKSALINKAYYKDNKWMVNTIDNGEMELSQVTSKNIKNVQADTFEGTIEQSLGHIIGSLDLLTGATESGRVELSRSITENGDLDKEMEKRRTAWQEDFAKNFLEYREMISGNMSEATATYVKNLTENAESVEDIMVRQLSDITKSVNDFKTEYEDYVQRIFAYLKQNGFVDTNDMKRNPGQGGRTIAIGTGTEKGQYSNYSVDQLEKDGIIIGNNKDGTYKIDNDRLITRFGYGYKAINDWVSDADKASNKRTKTYYETVIKPEQEKKKLFVTMQGSAGAYNVDYDHRDYKSYEDYLEKVFGTKSGKTGDGVLSSNGTSMLTAASNVTPINDGSVQLAQSDPQDTALFAKTGGPFDTLFNGIFAKINEISSVLPRSMEYIMPLERIFNEINHSKGTANNSKIQIDTVKIELNGKLELSNSSGQSVDIINEIKTNPILLRTLTQLISESMEKNINGGRSTYTGGVVKPRFN